MESSGQERRHANPAGSEEEKSKPHTARKPRAVGRPEVQNRSKAGAPGVNLVLDCKALTITDEVQSRETRSDRNER